MPRYQLAILLAEQPRIEAQRLSALITASSSPHLKESARRDLLRRVGKVASPPKDAPAEMPKTGNDPAKAAAWFAARGVRVEVA